MLSSLKEPVKRRVISKGTCQRLDTKPKEPVKGLVISKGTCRRTDTKVSSEIRTR